MRYRPSQLFRREFEIIGLWLYCSKPPLFQALPWLRASPFIPIGRKTSLSREVQPWSQARFLALLENQGVYTVQCSSSESTSGKFGVGEMWAIQRDVRRRCLSWFENLQVTALQQCMNRVEDGDGHYSKCLPPGLLNVVAATPVYHVVGCARYEAQGCNYSTVLESLFSSKVVVQSSRFQAWESRGACTPHPLLLCLQVRSFQGGIGDQLEEENTCKQPIHHVASHLFNRIRTTRASLVLPIIFNWVGEGNMPQRTDFLKIITWLRKEKRFKHALEITEWMIKEQPFELMASDYALLPYFTGKIFGPQKAEAAFLQIPSEYQKEFAYFYLLEIYAENDLVTEALHTWKKLQELDAHVRVFFWNLMLSILIRNGNESEFSLLLEDMKSKGIQYNATTYNLLIKVMAEKYDIDKMEEAFHSMKMDKTVTPDCVTYTTLAFAYLSAGLKEKALAAARNVERFEFKRMKKNTLDQIMIVYGALGKLGDVERVYKKTKTLFRFTSTHTFVSAIKAFGEAGSVERAKQVFEEISKTNMCRLLVPWNAILGVYARYGLMEMAEEIMKKLVESKVEKNAITCYHFLEGYLRAGRMEKVEEVLKEAQKIPMKEITATRSWLQTMLNILDLFAEKGDVAHAELFFQELKEAKRSRHPRAYISLLKAYVKAGRPADGILARLKEDQMTLNADMQALLEQLDQSDSVLSSK